MPLLKLVSQKISGCVTGTYPYGFKISAVMLQQSPPQFYKYLQQSWMAFEFLNFGWLDYFCKWCFARSCSVMWLFYTGIKNMKNTHEGKWRPAALLEMNNSIIVWGLKLKKNSFSKKILIIIFNFDVLWHSFQNFVLLLFNLTDLTLDR